MGILDLFGIPGVGTSDAGAGLDPASQLALQASNPSQAQGTAPGPSRTGPTGTGPDTLVDGQHQ